MYDLKNAKHVVLQFRNIFEAVNVQEVNNLMDAMDGGCKLTVIDIPDQFNVIAVYPMAVVKGSTNAAFAQKFINYVLSADGQAVMKKYGFAALP